MCPFQQLYRDAHGYVIRCPECAHYQLAFSRTVLSLTEEEFQKFLEIVDAYANEPETVSVEKDVILPTSCKGVYMVLTNGQLLQLHHMLQTADTECKALSLLQLFE